MKNYVKKSYEYCVIPSINIKPTNTIVNSSKHPLTITVNSKQDLPSVNLRHFNILTTFALFLNNRPVKTTN